MRLIKLCSMILYVLLIRLADSSLLKHPLMLNMIHNEILFLHILIFPLLFSYPLHSLSPLSLSLPLLSASLFLSSQPLSSSPPLLSASLFLSSSQKQATRWLKMVQLSRGARERARERDRASIEKGRVRQREGGVCRTAISYFHCPSLEK